MKSCSCKLLRRLWDNNTGLRRADTTDGRKVEDAGALPEAAAQAKERSGLDGQRVNIERAGNGKNTEWMSANG
ncbi:hypothetical protein [Yersinia bercovieri]|uniref:hypothetical protein n=1 Tax=Yersinia bercovieri TaxID=634 RepID=UPI001643B42C|nr:hypothetical protein [Yersinia bercovieri]